MFARSVSIRLKPNGVGEFSRLIENAAIPVLRKQRGFQDELTFVVSGGGEAVAISLWDEKENADTYGRNVYPRVLKALGTVVEGTPQVRTFEVCNSTSPFRPRSREGYRIHSLGDGQVRPLLYGKKESTYKRKRGFEMLANIMKWVCVSALFLAATFWRSAANYQLLLDFVVCMGAVVVVMQAVRAGEYRWAAGFVAIALLFNPVVRFLRPPGALPLLLVVACIAAFGISLVALKTQPLRSMASITDRNPGSESL